MHIDYGPVKFGGDPEMFFARRTQAGELETIGSEKILGILPRGGSTIVCDGVQVEFNLPPNACRAYLGNSLRVIFSRLWKNFLCKYKTLEMDFRSVVSISKKELDSLGEEAKQFGCEASYTVGRKLPNIMTLDGATYDKRSASGHIHLGRHYKSKRNSEILGRPNLLVPVLDIVIGNTCVLLDRDPMAAERRKHYGGAGEYRTPAHGLEYRVLSNFWLRDYKLFSFVMGLARWGVCIAASKPVRCALRKLVPRKDIVAAINQNDMDLAWANFEKVIDFLMEVTWEKPLPPEVARVIGVTWPLSPGSLPTFRKVVERGIDCHFGGDPVNKWRYQNEGHGIGWESFLAQQRRCAWRTPQQ